MYVFSQKIHETLIYYTEKIEAVFLKRGFKNQYRGVWGCLWIGSCVLWTEYWESYSCSPWLVVTEPYSIVAVFQRVARHPLVEILTTLNSSGYDNGAITKINLKKKIVPHYNRQEYMQFTIFTVHIMPPIYSSFLAQLIVSNFSCVLQSSKEKLKTIIKRFFLGRGVGGGGREAAIKVYYRYRENLTHSLQEILPKNAFWSYLSGFLVTVVL